MPAGLRNPFLLLVSLTFYSWGAGPIVLILIVSVIGNYFAGLVIHRLSGRSRLISLWIAIALNLSALFYYKYAAFAWDTLEDVAPSLLQHLDLERPVITLPIGISFFTFQAISYIADIYTGTIRGAPSLGQFGTYHTLFPQLIAGPIVRFVELEQALAARRLSLDLASAGAARFIIGLAKKILIADNVGLIVDGIYKLSPDQLSWETAWLGAIAYSIQILFDFSGYSDMAIGLGLLLGFRFPENFRAPYRATSVTEFWRRWHMTLSRWFRDYVYIPLGGNRRGHARTYLLSSSFSSSVGCGMALRTHSSCGGCFTGCC